MADLVSQIFKGILSCLWPWCAPHIRYQCQMQENVRILSVAIDELKEVRNNVKKRVEEAEADPNEPKRRIDEVDGWLKRVQNIEGEVEKLLKKADELQISRESGCLGGCCPPNNCWSNYKLGKSIAEKIPLVDELKGKGRFQELTDRLPPSSVQDENLESTIGMESMFDKVWRLINSTDGNPVRIMGLYGQGGVGKTTLLKKINNEFNKISSSEHGFDYVVIFLLVSKPINYEAIQKKIGERLGLSKSLQEGGNEQSRAQKIFNALKNKNYVLLLDDIWERVDLQRIGIPNIHPQGNSKLIFTTRLERVCGLMEAKLTFKLECLPWEKAWSLFQDKVGEEALNYFPTARELAKDVAKECGGLPLALITIGRAMSTNKSVEEWDDAIRTLERYASEFKEMRDDVLTSLKLSYDYLHNETQKSCFRYCSLYPEDYSIKIAQLVDIWIAEGLLNGFHTLDAARSHGHSIIGSLKNACLLESSDEQTHVKMHDVIRDLALWIVNDCSSTRSTDQSGSNSNKFLGNAERIFWDATGTTRSSSNEEENPPTYPNLLTLIVPRKVVGHYHWPPSFFQNMPLLRVLDLSHTSSLNDEFLVSISELHELQYLNLSGTFISGLPVQLRNLVKLKFLVLRNTYRLSRIPAKLIANLSELQVLDFGCSIGAGFEDWESRENGPSFSELDDLKQLQEVRISFSTYVAIEKFLCNRKLQMVCTGLKFSRLLHKSSARKSVLESSARKSVLDLSNFKSLKDLNISGYSELEELVLYGRTTDRGLLSNLETLSLGWFPKLNRILWTAAQPELLRSHFQKLHYISIDGCNALKDLTWLVYVQNLITLSVRLCSGLETIIELGDDGLEGISGGDQMLNIGGGGVFRRLKSLSLDRLPKLKSICRHALAFPSIETINISQCPELTRLPLNSGSNIENTLKVITGEPDWWNKLQWEDEIINFKFSPCPQ